MPKYELIKETDLSGESIYYTEKDGRYVEGSIKMDLERAQEIYNALVEKKTEKVIEVIKSAEV